MIRDVTLIQIHDLPFKKHWNLLTNFARAKQRSVSKYPQLVLKLQFASTH